MADRNSYLLVRVRYTGPHAGRKVATGFQELQFLASGDPIVLPEWEAEELVEKYDDLEIVEEKPKPRRRPKR